MPISLSGGSIASLRNTGIITNANYLHCFSVLVMYLKINQVIKIPISLTCNQLKNCDTLHQLQLLHCTTQECFDLSR